MNRDEVIVAAILFGCNISEDEYGVTIAVSHIPETVYLIKNQNSFSVRFGVMKDRPITNRYKAYRILKSVLPDNGNYHTPYAKLKYEIASWFDRKNMPIIGGWVRSLGAGDQSGDKKYLDKLSITEIMSRDADHSIRGLNYEVLHPFVLVMLDNLRYHLTEYQGSIHKVVYYDDGLFLKRGDQWYSCGTYKNIDVPDWFLGATGLGKLAHLF